MSSYLPRNIGMAAERENDEAIGACSCGQLHFNFMISRKGYLSVD